MKVFLYSSIGFCLCIGAGILSFFWDAADTSWCNEKKPERPPKHSLQPTLLGRPGSRRKFARHWVDTYLVGLFTKLIQHIHMQTIMKSDSYLYVYIYIYTHLYVYAQHSSGKTDKEIRRHMNRMYENKPRDTYNKRMCISVSTAVAISRSISRSISISISISIYTSTHMYVHVSGCSENSLPDITNVATEAVASSCPYKRTYIHTLHYITLHYITLHYFTLHYITLLHTYIHTYITLHYITIHYITLHYITLHYITLHYITLHYITLHYITLHYITYIHT